MPKRDIQIEVGGRRYPLPPLSIAILEQHEKEYDLVIEAMRNGRLPDRELLTAVRVLVTASIAEREPTFTEDMAKKGIAVGDAQALCTALLTQSGFSTSGEPAGKAVGP